MYKGIVQLVIGLMMIVTLLVGYLPIPEYLVELTCISNMLGGVLLTIDGILSIDVYKRQVMEYVPCYPQDPEAIHQWGNLAGPDIWEPILL